VAAVAVIGNLAWDVVDGATPRVGGAPFHAGRMLALLGADAVVVARCAAEDRDALTAPLVRLGLAVHWSASSSTARFAFRYDGGSREMTLVDPGEPWPDDGWADDALSEVGWVQIGALTNRDFPAQTLAALAVDRRLLLDGQGLVRSPRQGPLVLERAADRRALEHVSVLKLAEEEAAAAVDGLDERSLAGLGVPEVVVTLGDRGSLVLAEDTLERVPAVAVEATDPTGAGDGFAAAYLVARGRGAAPVEAARFAAESVARLLQDGP
jgi:sugar/nucleoside kinase (ribokinase family)